MSPIAFLATIVGERAARPVFFALIALLAIGIFGVAKCAANQREAAQAVQTSRSGEAMADAAENAVAQIVATSNRDRTVDEVVTQAAREIDAAPTTDAARAAAFRAVCQLPEYHGDPKCD